MLDNIAQLFKRAFPKPKRVALTQRARHVVGIQRAPRLELLDVFEEDHARSHGLRPLHDYPGERADFLADRLSPLGLAEVLAVRAGPEQSDRLAIGHHDRIDLEDIADEMPGLRMVDLVKRYGFWIMVDCNVNVAPNCLLDACRCTTPACEQVDYEFIVQG